MLQPSRGTPGNSIKTPPPACRSESPVCLKGFRSPFPIRCPQPYREQPSPWRKGLKPNCRPRTTIGRSRMSLRRRWPAIGEWRRSNSTTRSKWTLRRMNPRTPRSRRKGCRWWHNPRPYSCRPRWLRKRMSSVAEILAFLGIRRSLFLPRRNSLCRNLRPISRSVSVSGRSGSSSRIEAAWI